MTHCRAKPFPKALEDRKSSCTDYVLLCCLVALAIGVFGIPVFKVWIAN